MPGHAPRAGREEEGRPTYAGSIRRGCLDYVCAQTRERVCAGWSSWVVLAARSTSSWRARYYCAAPRHHHTHPTRQEHRQEHPLRFETQSTTQRSTRTFCCGFLDLGMVEIEAVGRTHGDWLLEPCVVPRALWRGPADHLHARGSVLQIAVCAHTEPSCRWDGNSRPVGPGLVVRKGSRCNVAATSLQRSALGPGERASA